MQAEVGVITQTALLRRDLPCMYLAHHEPQIVNIIVVIIIVIISICICIIVTIIILMIDCYCYAG